MILDVIKLNIGDGERIVGGEELRLASLYNHPSNHHPAQLDAFRLPSAECEFAVQVHTPYGRDVR
jgi:hypothetical protein